MHTKSALILALLPELLAARSVANAHSRRSVSCSLSTGATAGDTYDSFAGNWGVSVDELKSLNPGLDCSNFDGSKEYCVLGTVEEDEPSKTTTTSKVDKTISTSTSMGSTQPPSTTTANDHEPTQPGLADKCDKSHLVVDGDSCEKIQKDASISQAQFSKWNPYINDNCDKYHKAISGDQCDTIETNNQITDKQFRSWNPAIDDKCSNLVLVLFVCFHVPNASSTHGPMLQMPSLDQKCKKYHKVGDGEGCYQINQDAGITLSQFRKWNPTVDAQCSNLWAGYYVCTGV
ncbi:hypothetical protein N7471_008951 [Penicillium samsonianum]|uniref:uncharacterized protein n=1 Tax=Penicillium samsonianum TaxID=1882272 RepID=UPI002548380F|nr:uncharacterized protein N7471_008951 [Penicillium samsonianum]KAJ6127734.1 hypothetical protein N7471_008951 [Penicillium samsonianum]